MIGQLWQTMTSYSQFDPFRFVEVLMLSLALGLLAVWGIFGHWAYVVLSLSFAIGASGSVLIRETVFPSSRLRFPQITAIVLIGLSFYAFFELFRYY